MNEAQLRDEIRRLTRLLTAAAKKTTHLLRENHRLIDTVSAAKLHAQVLLKQLGRK